MEYCPQYLIGRCNISFFYVRKGDSMRILKVINNNIVSALDKEKKEVILMGRGLGFQKKAGEEIDPAFAEKIFSLSGKSARRFEELVAAIPYEHIRLAEEIISYAGRQLPRKLSKNIYITLTDHLNYAITRHKNGIEMQNALLWEIQKFYHGEYLIGLKALEIVEHRTGAKLPVDEAAFIALHLVNAEMDMDLKESTPIPGMIKDILNIIRLTMRIELDENSLSYERLVTHLKFYLQRVIKKEVYTDLDKSVFGTILEHCSKEYDCALKIEGYVKTKMGHDTSQEELIYLTIHINRVTSKETESL